MEMLTWKDVMEIYREDHVPSSLTEGVAKSLVQPTISIDELSGAQDWEGLEKVPQPRLMLP